MYGNVKEACQACDCFEDGSRDSQCSTNGKCDCRPGFSGLKCENVDQELLLWNDAFEDKIDSLDKVGIFGWFSNSSTLLTLMIMLLWFYFTLKWYFIANQMPYCSLWLSIWRSISLRVWQFYFFLESHGPLLYRIRLIWLRFFSKNFGRNRG